MRDYIYWDLDMFAIEHPASTKRKPKALRHVYKLTLKDVEFVIDKAERTRAMETGVKNLHARIAGTIIEFEPPDLPKWARVIYCYPKNETFVTLGPGHPITRAEMVYMEVLDKRAHIYAKGIS